MSYGLTANDWADVSPEAEVGLPAGYGTSESGLTVLPPDAPAQYYRSAMIPVAFALPVAVSGLGYLLGSSGAFLSDLAFLLITGLCASLLTVELLQFGRRLGIGAVLIYGGILVWFCHDYASNWFLHDYRVFLPYFQSVRADTVARAMFYHCLFIEMMVIAFRFPILRPLEKVVIGVPELANNGLYLPLVIGMLAVGWSAFLFTADLLPVSILKGALWFVPGVSPMQWLVGRGNTATTWGAYVAQILQVGQIGGILGGMYALLIARTLPRQTFGWFAWLYWTSFSFQGERRGEIAFMALPVLGIVFLKYHAERDHGRRVRNLKWLVATAGIVGVIWYAVQWQSANRSAQQVDLFRASGNTMFSEGLNSWVLIPDRHGFAYDSWPGETVVRPLPDAAWWLVTGPIPRMLWNQFDWVIGTKPIEPFALWYSTLISKDKRGVLTNGAEGTTVSTGAVGYWYFRYGPAGVVQGGLLYGFMMSLCERSLRRAQGRPLKVMFAMAFAAFLFRCYRDLWWHNLYPVLIGGVVMGLLIKLVFGARSDAGVTVPGLRPAPALAAA